MTAAQRDRLRQIAKLFVYVFHALVDCREVRRQTFLLRQALCRFPDQFRHPRRMFGSTAYLAKDSVMQRSRIDPANRAALRHLLKRVNALIIGHSGSTPRMGGRGHLAAAMGAVDDAAQVVGGNIFRVLLAAASAVVIGGAYCFPQFGADNCFMGVVVSPIAEDNYASVDFIAEQACDCIKRPGAVRHRFEVGLHVHQAMCLGEQLKGPQNKRRLFRMRHEPFGRLFVIAADHVGILGGFLCHTKGRRAAADIACLDHCLHLGLRPLAHLFNVHPVYELRHLLADIAADIIRELLFDHLHFDACFFEQVFCHLERVPASEPAHVGTDDDIKRACFRVVEQSLELFALQRRAGHAFIFVKPRQRTALLPDILPVKLDLNVNRREVFVRLVIGGTPGVNGVAFRLVTLPFHC